MTKLYHTVIIAYHSVNLPFQHVSNSHSCDSHKVIMFMCDWSKRFSLLLLNYNLEEKNYMKMAIHNLTLDIVHFIDSEARVYTIL